MADFGDQIKIHPIVEGETNTVTKPRRNYLTNKVLPPPQFSPQLIFYPYLFWNAFFDVVLWWMTLYPNISAVSPLWAQQPVFFDSAVSGPNLTAGALFVTLFPHSMTHRTTRATPVFFINAFTDDDRDGELRLFFCIFDCLFSIVCFLKIRFSK